VTSVSEAPLSVTGEYRAGSVRGAEGFFRVAQDATRRWWFIDPAGRVFFAKGVRGVCAVSPVAGSAVAPDPAALLRRCGFNVVGVGGDGAGRDDGLAFLALVEFARVGPPIVAPGVRLPDVFAPDWPGLAAERALQVCGPLADSRELLGWVGDDALGWGQPGRPDRPSLLQICLSLEPTFGTYHAAWEFTLALHGGRLDALARAWGVPLANKEVVRELTRAEKGIGTRGYLRDEARWTREFARRYFATTAAAIRAVDSRHLLLGCRFDFPLPAGSPVMAECVYPSVDVTMVDWNALPATGEHAGPVLAGNVGWASEAFWRSTSSSSARLTSVERMLRRGRMALERTARHPAVVGYLWDRWQDAPGEQPPFARGLLHVNGAEAREHTELLTQFNVRADTLRHTARAPNQP
jgi:hypothetical protein